MRLGVDEREREQRKKQSSFLSLSISIGGIYTRRKCSYNVTSTHSYFNNLFIHTRFLKQQEMSSMMYFLFIGCLLVFCQLQPLRAAPGADDPAPPRATPVTVAKLTAEDERTLQSTGRLSVVEAGTGVYVPGPIKYPCGQTWTSWWRQNFWYFQCLANQSCRPYRGCWCNLCACYMFIVYPTNPPCPRWTPWTFVSSVQLDGYIN